MTRGATPFCIRPSVRACICDFPLSRPPSPSLSHCDIPFFLTQRCSLVSPGKLTSRFTPRLQSFLQFQRNQKVTNGDQSKRNLNNRRNDLCWQTYDTQWQKLPASITNLSNRSRAANCLIYENSPRSMRRLVVPSRTPPHPSDFLLRTQTHKTQTSPSVRRKKPAQEIRLKWLS